jgi:hypothetical protein
MQICDHTARPMPLCPYIIGFNTLLGSVGGCERRMAICQKCAAVGKLALFCRDASSARAHVAAEKHDSGGVPIDIFRSLLTEVIEDLVALDYWPIHTVEHPVMRKYLGDGTLGKHHLNGIINSIYGWGEIGRRIGEEEFVAILSDSWSRFGLSMFGMVALGKTAIWLLDVVVPPEPTHSGHLLALVAEEVMARYQIPSPLLEISALK